MPLLLNLFQEHSEDGEYRNFQFFSKATKYPRSVLNNKHPGLHDVLLLRPYVLGIQYKSRVKTRAEHKRETEGQN